MSYLDGYVGGYADPQTPGIFALSVVIQGSGSGTFPSLGLASSTGASRDAITIAASYAELVTVSSQKDSAVAGHVGEGSTSVVSSSAGATGSTATEGSAR